MHKHRLTGAAALTALLTSLPVNAADGVLRANQAGYLTDDIKAAVYLGDIPASELRFAITDGNDVIPVDSVVAAQPWAPHKASARVCFSSLSFPGRFTLTATDAKGNTVAETPVYVGDDAYSRLLVHELPLYYLRQQRCGFNPVHNALCHQHDGRLVLSGADDGRHIDVRGGWHDASDYLQYLTTSANTVYQLLFAYRENPGIWADSFDAAGLPGSNGIPDIVDEARWGLEWMTRMNPNDSLYLNQIADDRDHRYVGVPQNDNTDYGWGPGGARPVYPCSGKPYGLKNHFNDSKGLASSVGKFASSFGLGAEVMRDFDPDFASDLARRSEAAYKVARANPGACQTAPCVSPYYYEEDNWVDDMELAAMARYRATGDVAYLREAVDYGRMEPVTPWMGADSAHHYQWYPFVNLGHNELARSADPKVSREFLRNMRSGLDRVAARGADNVWLNGIPFIWCSNNLAVAFVTQAMLYRELTGDNTYREAETAMRDWLFGINPWGQTMMIMPSDSGIQSPRDPHSAMVDITVDGLPGRDFLIGGLVDGPVYANIFKALWGVHLRNDDRFAGMQNDTVVYHDDFSDYSSNEPTMDGTASLTFMLGRLAAAGKK